jgi:hypothetical protein
MAIKSWLRRLEVHRRNESRVVLLLYLARQNCLGDLCVVGCINVVYYDVS